MVGILHEVIKVVDPLVYGFAQVLHVCHRIDCFVREYLGGFSMRQHANKLEDSLVLPYKRIFRLSSRVWLEGDEPFR